MSVLIESNHVPRLRINVSTPWLFALALLQLGTAAMAYPFQTRSVRVTDYGSVMQNGLATADFTGDGIDEIFIATTVDTPLLIAMTQELLALRPAQVFPLPSGSYVLTTLHVWHAADGPVLISVTASDLPQLPSSVRLYRGWPLALVNGYMLPSNLSGVAIGDLESDGAPELVASIGGETRIFSLSDGQLQGTLAVAANRILVANLDSDPAAEIVFATTPGRVFDGVTRLQEWSYPDPFGDYLAAGRIGSNGAIGFVGAQDWGYFTVFRSTPWSPVWDYGVSDIDGIAIHDLDGVGADEIIQGDGQGGGIRIIDSQTRALRLAFWHEGRGVAALGAVKTAIASGKEVILAAGSVTNGMTLSVMRSSDGGNVYQLQSDQGGIGATSIGDIDADGQVELVAASSGFDPARIRVVNATTGADEWLSPPDTFFAGDPFQLSTRFLFQTQLDADPAVELVVVGQRSHSARVLVVDGITKAVQLQIGRNLPGEPLDSVEIGGAALVDYGGDSRTELAIVTRSFQLGVRIQVFSLLTGAVLWNSSPIGQAFGLPRGLHLQRSAGHEVLVAALPDGLRAFGVQSQALEWSHPAQIHRAVYLADAPGSAEILIETSLGAVTHIDAETRVVRRNYQLAGPTTAIAAVPGSPHLVVGHAASVSLVALDGTVIGSAPDLYGTSGPSPVAFTAGLGGMHVLTGTGFGYVLRKLDPDGVFGAGFEVVDGVIPR